MKIGIAGTGRMGAAIAQRLLGLGHEVTVWNRTAEKTGPLAAAGAKVAATPSRLASASETVITILTDAAAIAAAYHSKDGLLSSDVSGRLFVEMSTVRPETTRALAGKIRAKGAAMIECPVGGTIGPAKDGKLFGFVGGDAADVGRAKSLLEQMCRRIEHVGPVGAGASMKLAINLPLLVFWQAFGEALALCRPLGRHWRRRSRERPLGPSPWTSTRCARICGPWSRKPKRSVPSFRSHRAPWSAMTKLREPDSAKATSPRSQYGG